jgi:hypothetical protein
LPPPGPLAGKWQGSKNDQFDIEDDGKSVTASLLSNTPNRSFVVKMTRSDDDPQMLIGSADAIFPNDTTLYTVDITAKIVGQNKLGVHCSKWPHWDKKGKWVDNNGSIDDSWTRSDVIPAGPRARPPRGNSEKDAPFAPEEW